MCQQCGGEFASSASLICRAYGSLCEVAKDIEVTFHRAFDVAGDPSTGKTTHIMRDSPGADS